MSRRFPSSSDFDHLSIRHPILGRQGRRLLEGAGGERRRGSDHQHTHARKGRAGERTISAALMADDAASMETDEGGAEMCRALAGAKVSPIYIGRARCIERWIDQSIRLPGSRQQAAMDRAVDSSYSGDQPPNQPTTQPTLHIHSARA